MEVTKTSVFGTLNAINCNEHTEKKNGLTYLSWAWALAELMKIYPEMSYEVRHWDNKPYLFDENLGYMVETSVTIGSITRTMWLPVMDSSNKAMKSVEYYYEVSNPNFKYAKKGEDGVYRDGYGREQKEKIKKTVQSATMFDINTAIMRCLVKNFAMFGLGLYIYSGEDLPEGEQEAKVNQLADVLESIAKATSKAELGEIYNANKDLQGVTEFMNALSKRKKEVK